MKEKRYIFLALVLALVLTGCCLSHTWQEADCLTPKTCLECGGTEGEALGHNWQAASCEAPETCSRCGGTQGEALGHDWQAASCEAPKTCARCSATEGEALGHSWQEATCAAPKTCTLCGATEGEAPGHQMPPWTAGEETMTRTCTLCGQEERTPMDHEAYLASYLQNRWWSKEWEYKGDTYTSSRNPESLYDGKIPYLEFPGNGEIRLFNGEDILTAQWEYTGYLGEGRYAFQAVDEGKVMQEFRFRILEDGKAEIQFPFSDNRTTGYFYQESPEEAAARELLLGTWVFDRILYGDALKEEEPNGRSITFREDGTCTVQANKQYEGVYKFVHSGVRSYDNSLYASYQLMDPEVHIYMPAAAVDLRTNGDGTYEVIYMVYENGGRPILTIYFQKKLPE